MLAADMMRAQAVPRVNSKGALCGSVYRVASDVNMAGLTSA